MLSKAAAREKERNKKFMEMLDKQKLIEKPLLETLCNNK